jgi:hypothetical protein
MLPAYLRPVQIWVLEQLLTTDPWAQDIATNIAVSYQQAGDQAKFEQWAKYVQSIHKFKGKE